MKTVRLVFSKTGRARFMSHLDLMRTMTRALRRAGLPVWYTEGFNRHPYVTFAAPLSLGYEGLRETMDFRLEEEMDGDEIVRRLGAVLPEGLAALSAAEADRKPGQVALARYRLAFRCEQPLLEAFLRQETLPVAKQAKNGALRTVDIRPLLRDTALSSAQGETVLEVTLPCGSNNSVNPSLLLQALRTVSDDETISMRVTRCEVMDENGQPFR